MTAAEEARPDATWGMTEEAKRQWHEKHGDKLRKQNAKKDKESA